MSYYAWNLDKNSELIRIRDISFERVIYHIERDGLLDIIKHPNQIKYPKQKMFIVNISDYAYLVQFVENNNEIFLKTIISSRKATKKYIKSEKHD